MSATISRVLGAAGAISSLLSGPAVQLDSFAFADFEVPERMRWGGEQAGTLHKLIGGDRVLDMTGPDEAPIEWEGILLGPNAKDRARDLDALRQYGGPYDLDWAGSSQRVWLRSCTFEEGFHEIRYRISCEVIPVSQDEQDQDQYGATASVPDGARQVAANASGFVASANAALSTVSNVVSQVGSAVTAIAAPVAAVVGTVANVAAVAQVGIAQAAAIAGRDLASSTIASATQAVLGTAAGFNGVLTAAQNAASLAATASNLARSAALITGR